MPKEITQSEGNVTSPDYIGLVKSLLEPFLDQSESLSVHCEHLPSTNKIWLRVAFDAADKGKVFGRGGRNIQAVSTILKTAAIGANQSLHLDVYNSNRESSDRRDRFGGSGRSRSSQGKKQRPRRPERK